MKMKLFMYISSELEREIDVFKSVSDINPSESLTIHLVVSNVPHPQQAS